MATNNQLYKFLCWYDCSYVGPKTLIPLQTLRAIKSLQSASQTLGLGMRLHICLACCFPSLNSGAETLSPPLTHPGSPADRLQTDAEHPTTSAIRSFPPSNTLGFSSYSAPMRPYSILQAGEEAWFTSSLCLWMQSRNCCLQSNGGCSIFYYVYTP